MVCAVGGAPFLVGRTSACNYPPEALAGVPVVGGFGAPSLELLVTARPTLILDVALADEALGRRIEALGLRRERIACETLADVPRAIERVGALLGREPDGRRLAAEFTAEARRLRGEARTSADRPAVFVEIWSDPVVTVGRGSFVSELVALAGGRNIGDDVEKPYFQVSQEWVVARNPDVVVCLYMSESGPAGQGVLARRGWSGVRAVREKRVYDGFDNDLLLRPGPRALQGARELRRRIHGGNGR